MKAPLPFNEEERLLALQEYQVLDTAPEEKFDELTRLAAQICQTPMASITFIDERRQWHKSKLGLEGDEAERDITFCAHTVAGSELLIVPDATNDERFADNPFVTGEPGIRFYAGMPLVTPAGLSVGSLCVIDTVPRALAPQQLEALETLSRQAMAQLELRPDFAEEKARQTPASQSRRERLAQRRLERREVAEALQVADARYRGLFETTSEGLLIVDAQSGVIEETNAFLSEMLGIDVPLRGRRVWQIAALQDLFTSESKWAAVRAALQESGDVRAAEIELTTAEGRKLWVEFRAHLDDSGARAMTRCNLRDITQNKLDREALRVQQEHHRTLLELSLNAVIVMDARGDIVQWNPAAEAMFGRARAEVIGRPVAEIIVPPALRGQPCDVLGHHLSSFENHALNQRIEVSAMRDDGTEFPVELAIARHDGQDGPIFLASLCDITNRKRMEDSMRRATDELELRVTERTAELSETNAQLQLKIADHQRAEERLAATAQRLRGVLESISDAFVSLDSDRRFTYINEPAQRLMGKSSDELLGREVREGFPDARDSIFGDDWCKAACSGQPIVVESYYAPWKIWLEIHAYPSEGGLSIYFQDISARRADQFALEEAKRDADAANAAKSEFLGRMSHELRTPLNAILGFGQILDRQDMTLQQHESVSYILKSGGHLLDLINEVLDIARVESGHVELNLEAVSIADSIAEACALMRPLADARAIALRLPDLPEVEDCADFCANAHVTADAQRFAQVMINLLSNAVKYNFDQGEVEIAWREQDDFWRISVRDSGPGIAAENLPRLFVPFERGSATDSEIEGTGLGLALTLNLIEAMGGQMHVESAPGHGSTFSFDLPRADPPAPQDDATASPQNADFAPELPPAEQEVACAYRVLCIEDNPSNLRLIELVLATRPEIDLLSAGCASGGLQLATQHEPDLILLDLNLPDMHGSQVLRQLQTCGTTRDIPVIVISADATATQIETLLDAGATAYLTKPLDMRHLLRTLDHILQPTT